MPSTLMQRAARLPFTSIAAAAFVIAGALTAFYFVHEQLPSYIRAPTSLLLSPIAIVDGICHYARIPGIYGKVLPMFLAMFSATLATLYLVAKLLRYMKK